MPHPIPISLAQNLAARNNDRGISLETWIEGEGRFDLALGYAALFWPKFALVGKYLLQEGCSPQAIAGFENQPNATPKGVESVLNHIHLADIHSHDQANLSADKLLFLGRILQQIWQAKLAQEFPERPCTVEFHIPDDPDQLGDYRITFWQTAWAQV